MNKKKVWLSVGLAVALSLTVLVGAVWAQGPQGEWGQGRGMEFPGGQRGGLFGNDKITDLLGDMTLAELRAELQAGKSLLEIAQEQGVTTAEIVDVVVAGYSERLTQAVENGNLMQEQADYLLADKVEHTTWLIENDLFMNRQENPIVELLGLTPAELRTAMQEGKTLLEIATEQSVTVDELVEVMTEQRAAQLQVKVITGDLTQEQADYLLEHEREMMTWKLENGLGGGKGFMRGGAGRGFDGHGGGMGGRGGRMRGGFGGFSGGMEGHGGGFMRGGMPGGFGEGLGAPPDDTL